MQVNSYIKTLPSKLLARPHADNPKVLTLQKFIQGVNAVGDTGQVVNSMDYSVTDVAMMLGWVHEHGKTAPHLAFRKQIVDQQLSKNKRIVIADSNLFLYKDPSNPHYYLRYSYDGVFPNTGEYCDQSPDPKRWQTISKHMDLSLRKWRKNGNHILLCLQRDGGWSMAGTSVLDWTNAVIGEIRQYTDRPIRIRSHPGDAKAGRYLPLIHQSCVVHGWKNIEISNMGSPYIKELKNSWAVVNHNSSPTVGAAIEGIPVFVTDVIRSQAKDVANTKLSDIEKPHLFDRQPWVERLAMFHWSYDDLTSGRCWQHMRKWAIK